MLHLDTSTTPILRSINRSSFDGWAVGVNIEPSNDEAIIEARIPDFGNELKVRYLSYRAIGFNVKESTHLTGVTSKTIRTWRKNDEDFKSFELDNLRDLQKTAAKDLIELEFRRSFVMLLKRDARTIEQAMQDYGEGISKVSGFELLSDREWEYFKTIRKFYTPDQMLQLSKALEPEAHQENRIIVLEWGGRAIQDEPQYDIKVIDGPDSD